MNNQNTASYLHHWLRFRTQNDEQSLYWLYHAEFDRLYRFGLLSTQDPSLVKSAINAVFVDCWVRRPQLPEVDNVPGYLFVCFKRQLFHSLRAETNKAVTLPGDWPQHLAETYYEEAVVGHEPDDHRKALIRKALEALTPRQRDFIRLRFFEELDYEEIAEQSNTSVRTVYNTIHSALNRLRLQLGDIMWLLACLLLKSS